MVLFPDVELKPSNVVLENFASSQYFSDKGDLQNKPNLVNVRENMKAVNSTQNDTKAANYWFLLSGTLQPAGAHQMAMGRRLLK